MNITKGENIEHQILEAIKEILKLSDPDYIKASIILRRIRTILGLKDLASAPDLYEACKEIDFQLTGANIPFSQEMFNAKQALRQALAKAKEGK